MPPVPSSADLNSADDRCPPPAIGPARRGQRPLGLLSCAVLGLVVGASAGRAAWQVVPDPPAEPVKLSVKPGQSIPLPNPSGMAYLVPTTPSAFVAVGQVAGPGEALEVWDLRTFKKAGAVKGKIAPTSYTPSRLSPDGKYLAVLAADSDKERAIEVWSSADSKRLCRIAPSPPPAKILAFDFAAGGRLAVALEVEEGNKKSKALRSYEVATGELAGSVGLPEGFQDASFALSPGRKFLAYFESGKAVHVLDLAAGKEVGTIEEKCFSTNGMAFSPDGTELAALFGPRIAVWDLKSGEVAVEHQLPSGPDFPTPGWHDGGWPAIDWLPDGSAWLLKGHALVNRKDGRWVWNLFTPPFKDPKTDQFLPGAFIYTQVVKVLDNDHVLGGLNGRSSGNRLEVGTIPWPQIDASLKVLDAAGPALLGPGQAVSLKFELGSLRFTTPQEVQAGFTEAIAAALESEGVKVAEGRPVVLVIRHSEEPGPPYRIVGLGLRGTGQSITSTKFNTELALTVAGMKAPIWTSQKGGTGLGRFANDRQTGGKVDEAAMRLGGFRAVLDSLKNLGVPYFIPRLADKKLAMLPGTTLLTPAPASASARARAGAGNPRAEKPTLRGRSTEKARTP